MNLHRPIVIPGGTGQIGALLQRWFRHRRRAVTVLTRNPDAEAAAPGVEMVVWDGESLGPWARELDGAAAVINLAGRSVNCRYNEAHLEAMLRSRVESTRVVGEAIAAAEHPPPVWLQMSTATLYAHRYDAPNDEASGRIGGDEAGVPDYWARSVDIARAWEAALDAAPTPDTRRVAMRTAMVMSPDEDGVFDVLATLTKRGLGGAMAGGEQWVSWIHGLDFCRAVDALLTSELTGPVNVAAPEPLPQRAFQRHLREAMGVRIGLPAAKWMLEIGAFFMRTDTELLLKSRRVVPGRLLDAGFEFAYATWPEAAAALVPAWRGDDSDVPTVSDRRRAMPGAS